MKYLLSTILAFFIFASTSHAADQDSIKIRNNQRIEAIDAMSKILEQYYRDNVKYPGTKYEFAQAISNYGNTETLGMTNDPLFGKSRAKLDCKKWYRYEVYSDSNGNKNGAYKLSSCIEGLMNIAANDGGTLKNSYEKGNQIDQKIKRSKKFFLSKYALENSVEAPYKILDNALYAGIIKDSYVEWKKSAKITVLEYSDLECPFCIMQRQNGIMSSLKKKYGDSVNIVFKPVNLVRHPGADQKGKAALCVAKLWGTEKFSKYYGAIMDKSNLQGSLFPVENLSELAEEVGVNKNKFDDCYEKDDVGTLYEKYTTESSLLWLQGTPTTVIVNNSTLEYDIVQGAYPLENFTKAIDGLLERK